MKRIVTVAISAAFSAVLAGLLLPDVAAAEAQAVSSELRIAQAPSPVVTDLSAQRRRPLRRVPIYSEEWAPSVYPRYNPGPNAVRDCTAHYVQEYRPSGTVITPRMNCWWRPG
ncbi:hypothetical protein GWE18_29055 [Bradyrhizobium sp. CSA112]|uniref:hypothetical protein n=1 Tax=Bradyrhizobium sp. CSA112 TaxID=2699170 RepID=UPI0023B060BE|nr:hypothetical protein [Bradyrhizobium sp. CSA112]MDE5456804.1 hypothetical protein [Bradyrhizobium sp. CSA112]